MTKVYALLFAKIAKLFENAGQGGSPQSGLYSILCDQHDSGYRRNP